jgi:hypothetical protein
MSVETETQARNTRTRIEALEQLARFETHHGVTPVR